GLHTPEQVVRKLREADRLVSEGEDAEEVVTRAVLVTTSGHLTRNASKEPPRYRVTPAASNTKPADQPNQIGGPASPLLKASRRSEPELFRPRSWRFTGGRRAAANGFVAIGNLPLAVVKFISNPVVIPRSRFRKLILHFGLATGSRDVPRQHAANLD